MTHEPLELGPGVDERTQLSTFLDWNRDVLERKCSGLTDAQLRTRSVAPSSLTLLGLMRHLAGVERFYFRAVVDGAWPGGLFPDDGPGDPEFDQIETLSGDAVLALWREQVEASRAICARYPLDHRCVVPDFAGPPLTPGRAYSLRWVMTHLIEEYARHNGHADLLREAIDGSTGE